MHQAGVRGIREVQGASGRGKGHQGGVRASGRGNMHQGGVRGIREV